VYGSVCSPFEPEAWPAEPLLPALTVPWQACKNNKKREKTVKKQLKNR